MEVDRQKQQSDSRHLTTSISSWSIVDMSSSCFFNQTSPNQNVLPLITFYYFWHDLVVLLSGFVTKCFRRKKLQISVLNYKKKYFVKIKKIGFFLSGWVFVHNLTTLKYLKSSWFKCFWIQNSNAKLSSRKAFNQQRANISKMTGGHLIEFHLIESLDRNFLIK